MLDELDVSSQQPLGHRELLYCKYIANNDDEECETDIMETFNYTKPVHRGCIMTTYLPSVGCRLASSSDIPNKSPTDAMSAESSMLVKRDMSRSDISRAVKDMSESLLPGRAEPAPPSSWSELKQVFQEIC